MNLVDIYSTDSALITLYQLLQERTPEQSISHKEMPSWEEHVAYIAKRPVPHWYLIEVGGPWVGSIYLSRRREIGVQLFRQEWSKGYGRAAVNELMRRHPGEFYANVNPANVRSQVFFRGLAYRMVQVTFKFGVGG